MASQNVWIDPPRLGGDKWFTDNFSTAYPYAYPDFDRPEKIPGAVFQAVLSNDLYLAQEIPRDPSTNESMGAWAKALLDNPINAAREEDERKYVRAVLNLRFGTKYKVAGLLKGHERFVLDCDSRMWDLSVVSHRMKEGDAPFIAEGLH